MIQDFLQFQALRRGVADDNAVAAGFDRLCRVAARSLRASAALLVLDEEGMLRLSSQWSGTGSPLLPPDLRLPGELFHPAGRPEVLVVDDPGVHPDFAAGPAAAALGGAALLALPLVSPTAGAFGVLCLLSEAPRSWSTDEVELARELVVGAVEETELRAEREVLRRSAATDARDGDLRLLRDSSGEPLCAIAMVRDVSEHKRAEEALRRSEAWSRLLVESAPDAILVYRRGRISFANPAAVRLLAADSPESLVGRSVLDFVHPDDQPATRQLLVGRAAAPSQSPLAEKRVLAMDGRTVYAEVAWFPMPGVADGSVLVIARDVSERRALQQQLLLSHKLEAVGRLAGGVAHDFNNLLTVIVGHSLLLEGETPRTGEAGEHVRRIRQSAEQATSLTRQLLAVGRKQVLQPKLVDLNQLVQRLEPVLQGLLGEQVVLQTLTHPFAYVFADPVQLEQILLDLVSNARDAMTGPGRISVTTGLRELARAESHSGVEIPAGSYTVLSVQDTGRGMDEATIARIFDPFFTTKATGEGVGLGLATVYGVVKQSGGWIFARSQPGQGTTFTLHFPRAEPHPTDRGMGAPAADRLGAPATVLVVEDHESLRRLAEAVLRKRGYRVLVAANGEEALQVVAANPEGLDLLITDIVMPRMSGQTLARRILARHPGVRVAFMSGYPGETLENEGLAGLSFLAKPFTPSELAAFVADALEADSALPTGRTAEPVGHR